MYGFNSDRSKAENVLDIGQENADLIGADLANSLAANPEFFIGNLKYDKIGDMVIVYVSGTTYRPISEIVSINAEALPSAYRPSPNQQEECRSIQSANLIVGTDGAIELDPNGETIAKRAHIQGEVAYFV